MTIPERPEHRRLPGVLRVLILLGAVVSVLLLIASSIVITSMLSWDPPLASVLNPRTQRSFLTDSQGGAQQVTIPYDDVTGFSGSRTSAVAVTVQKARLSAVITVKSTITDPLVTDAIAGRFRKYPIAFAELLGGPSFQTSQLGYFSGFTWSAPTVSSRGKVVTISQTGVSPAGLRLKPPLVITETGSASLPTALSVTVAGGDWTVTALSVPSTRLKGSSKSLTTRPLREAASVTLDSPGEATETTAPAATSETRLWTDIGNIAWQLLRAVWLLSPWLVLLVLAARASIGSVSRGNRLLVFQLGSLIRVAASAVFITLLAFTPSVLSDVGLLAPSQQFALLSSFAETSHLYESTAIPAGLSLLIVSLLLLVRRPDPAGRPARSSRTVILFLLVAGALAVGLAASTPDPAGVSFPLAAVALAVFTLGAAALTALTSLRTRVVNYLWVIVLPLVIAIGSNTALTNQPLGRVLVLFFVVGVLAVLTVFCFSVSRSSDDALAGATRPSLRSRTTTARFIAAVAGAAAAVALLWPRLPTTAQFRPAFDLTDFAYTLEQLIAVAIIASTLILITRTSSLSPKLSCLSMIALMVGLIFRPGNLYSYLPVSLGVGTLLVLFFLLPGLRQPGGTASARQLLFGDDSAIKDATVALMTKSATSKLDREIAGAIRKQLTTTPGKASDISDARSSYDAETKSEPPTRAERAAGLQWGGEASPWKRAGFGAVVATVVSVPFSMAFFANFLQIASQAGGEGWLENFIYTVLAFKFPMYGFAFGFFFPIIRGISGLSKGVAMFVVLAITESIVILLPFNDATDVGLQIALRLVQIAVTFIALGAAFDLRSLFSAGYGIDQVGDLFNRNRLTVWSSGIAVTALSALLTTLLATATTQLVDRLIRPPRLSGIRW